MVTAALVGIATAGLVGLGALVSATETDSVTVPSAVASRTASTSQTRSSIGSAISQTAVSSVPNGYFLVAALEQLSGKTYVYFTHPTFGNSILLNVNDQWKAFSATCTHRPCTVEYQSAVIYCPCHAGTFSPVDGSVEGGPPPSPLPEYAVIIQNNNIYVGSARIN